MSLPKAKRKRWQGHGEKREPSQCSALDKTGQVKTELRPHLSCLGSHAFSCRNSWRTSPSRCWAPAGPHELPARIGDSSSGWLGRSPSRTGWCRISSRSESAKLRWGVCLRGLVASGTPPFWG